MLGVSASTSVACAEEACCATVGSNVMCRGDNDQGQLGRGFSSTNENMPALVQTSGGTNLGGIIDVEAADATFCARTADHRVVCWGDNSGEQTGTDRTVAAEKLDAGLPDYVGGL